jgi:hypothetical protein
MLIYNTNRRYNSRPPTTLSQTNQKYVNHLKEIVKKDKYGTGLVNTMLKHLPEMHLSLPNDVKSEKVASGSFQNTGKYSFCGPGTKVVKRINEGYKGVNSLDKACRQHDVAYSKFINTNDRNNADDVLAQQTTVIAVDENEPAYVRKDARLVTGIMGIKSRFGLGMLKKKRSKGFIKR